MGERRGSIRGRKGKAPKEKESPRKKVNSLVLEYTKKSDLVSGKFEKLSSAHEI